MANLTVTVPDAQVPRVIAAFEVRYGRQPGETDTQLARRVLAMLVRGLVLDYEQIRDGTAAQQAVTPIDAS